ncbi:CBS domain-containing protein [Cellulosimicrobium sp. NPDC057127]|uniref:CBS domain-containing protein n=1 Tax=Cellulosimicrobium sp. NPDC057127 TaxID=3346026 RepID=UPI0036367178
MARRTVSDYMTPAPTVIEQDETLRSAAQTMAQQDVGALIVAAHGEITGIVTDRDIVVRGLAEGLDGDAHVREVTSGRLATLGPDDPVAQAVQIMRDAAVRRVPVMDGSVVVGIVSIGDLAVALDSDSALADVSEAPPND